MTEPLLHQLLVAVLRRQPKKPRALVIGAGASLPEGYFPVTQAPYDAVWIASLTLQELMLPPEAILHALLEGIPVYLSPDALPLLPSDAAPELARQLHTAERTLRAWGVQSLGARTLITQPRAERLRARGLPLPEGALVTPLAKDFFKEE